VRQEEGPGGVGSMKCGQLFVKKCEEEEIYVSSFESVNSFENFL